jgi:protein PhnA
MIYGRKIMSEGRCPKCNSENVYLDRDLWICPECSHEWINGQFLPTELAEQTTDSNIRDVNGNVLNDGDSVIVIKDLKIKGSSNSVKGGTKVRNIRLTDGDDGHNIACKIDGIGSINLKSEFVKKV